jgi:hypothetical protein
MNIRIWTLIFVATVVVCRPVLGDGVLTVLNNGDSNAELWVWPKSTGEYLRPETYVARRSWAHVTYREGERYWLVVRDDSLRESPIGWFNISETLKKNPGVQLALDKVYHTETYTETEQVWDYQARAWVSRNRQHVVKIGVYVPRWIRPNAGR